MINLALNFLCGGTCLDDIGRLRNDAAFLDALGARRIPDPTTAGDFLRRFGYDDNLKLMDAINEGNRWAWRQARAADTTAILDIGLRGDSAFNLTYKFDEWDAAGVEFCFGCPATKNLRETAAKLGKKRWRSLGPVRRKRTEGPKSQKEHRARERNFHNIEAHQEHVAEFDYRPSRCSQEYRIVVVRKKVILSGGQRGLFSELDTRYFFYVTNIRSESAGSIIDFIHKRCDHENRIEQLKNGMPALHTPCAAFEANQAWMLIGILAHNIKSWLCLMHPEPAVRSRLLSFEFKTFFREFILIPCQILRTGRRLVFRFLNTNCEFVELIAIMQAMRHRPA